MVLKEVGGSRTIPIWVQMGEMFSLALQLSNGKLKLPRPIAHDLSKSVILSLQARVDQVVITDIEDYIYYAQVTLVSPEKTLKIDARPSDACVLALKFGAPICVVEEVAEKHNRLTREAGLSKESLEQRLKELQLEDIINLSV